MPTSRSQNGRNATPASPVPQPRSSTEPNLQRLCRPRAFTASSRIAGAAIVQPPDQRRVEIRRVLVEQPRAHRSRSSPASPPPRRAAPDAAARRDSPRGRRRAPPGRRRPRRRGRRPARGSSPSANQAVAKPGAVSTTCSRISAAAAGSPLLRDSPAPSRSAGRRPDRRRTRIAVARPCSLFSSRPDMTYLSAMRPEDLLAPTPSGVCCKPGGFLHRPDPAGRQGRDHARPFRPCAAGHGAVLATQETLDMMRLRYGENFAGTTQAVRYGETLTLGGATVTFHPAGHVLGSAQVAVECKGMRIVASGDYKDDADPTCAPFELQPCDVFITEATFGLPVFRHGDADGRNQKAAALGRIVSRARASGRRLFARQGAARHRAAAAGRLRQADLSARRDGEDHPLLREPRHRSRLRSSWSAARRRPSLPAPSRSARRPR